MVATHTEAKEAIEAVVVVDAVGAEDGVAARETEVEIGFMEWREERKDTPGRSCRSFAMGVRLAG